MTQHPARISTTAAPAVQALLRESVKAARGRGCITVAA